MVRRLLTRITSRVSATSVFKDFINAYPAYTTTQAIDTLRARDFRDFDKTGEIYLDYTGGGRYGASQLRDHMAIVGSAVFGNPHSDNPSSRRSTEWSHHARRAVLDYFNAPEDEYTVIFTPNASGALRIVGEAYPFEKGGQFLQLIDNHNSVNGIREFARHKGASHSVIPTVRENMQARTADVVTALKKHTGKPHLFAYPAQSNFTGVQHPLSWISMAHAEGWDVILDAAAFAPTNRLDLSLHKPDFVPISFYKMFGWPTGIGCLIVRKSALAKLHKPWFAGGTIWAVSVQADWHVLAPTYEAFEDGTINYLGLPAVIIGLEYLEHVGIDTIHTRVTCLTDYLLAKLTRLTHTSGKPLVTVYGPTTMKGRGATVAFNFLDPTGAIVDERVVERAANHHKISLRTGCFCNPGSGEIAFNLPPVKLTSSFGNGEQVSYDHYLDVLGLESAGAIRISLGLVSSFADATAFLRFAETFRDFTPNMDDLPLRSHC